MLSGDDALSPADRVRLASALLGAGVRAPARRLLRGPAHGGGLERLARAYQAWVGEAVRPAAGDESPEPPGAAVPIERAMQALASTPDTPGALADLLDAAVLGLWGVAPDAPAGAVAFRPALPAGWGNMAIARLRIGATVLDVEIRRRRDGLAAHLRRASGPPLVVTLEPLPALAGPTLVDDVELQGGRVRFEAVDRHEIGFHGAPA